jgi:hypothetical protein
VSVNPPMAFGTYAGFGDEHEYAYGTDMPSKVNVSVHPRRRHVGRRDGARVARLPARVARVVTRQAGPRVARAACIDVRNRARVGASSVPPPQPYLRPFWHESPTNAEPVYCLRHAPFGVLLARDNRRSTRTDRCCYCSLPCPSSTCCLQGRSTSRTYRRSGGSSRRRRWRCRRYPRSSRSRKNTSFPRAGSRRRPRSCVRCSRPEAPCCRGRRWRPAPRPAAYMRPRPLRNRALPPSEAVLSVVAVAAEAMHARPVCAARLAIGDVGGVRHGWSLSATGSAPTRTKPLQAGLRRALGG